MKANIISKIERNEEPPVSYKEALKKPGVYTAFRHAIDGDCYAKYVIVFRISGGDDVGMYSVGKENNHLIGPLSCEWTEPHMSYRFEPNLTFSLEP